MDLALLGSLAVLALIDSTSFGTLLIPIWLLLDPGPVRVGRILTFLGTVAAFYLVVGVAMAMGASAFLPRIGHVLDTPAVVWGQLVLGVALFFWSFRLDGRRRPLPRVSERNVVGLALVAAAAEVSTMLPYLAAIGLLTSAELPIVRVVPVMAGYCLLMIGPALVLLVVRTVAGDRVSGLLTRFSEWMAKSSSVSWIVGIVGFLLAYDAAGRLSLLRWGG
ncbi:GAP family protein [Actinoplanes sp. L3-i22]|uniref:GAP family protein n=1 Tax=Actinoplanes sp. L3-i22 TaxID=2836373 RepID=UPI001C752730|nr:GAP family protein [Actinoplanes sp. L3-i22]BCY07783.1 hypothetical protein L3i22_028710 [Actinoplanes sp. L3-i22]